MAVKNYQATVSIKEEVAKSTYLVRFSLPENETMDFLPGQFVTIAVAPNARRSYSIASSPSHNTYVETFADTFAGGPGSQFFENVKVGDQVSFLAPLGKFVYKSDNKPVYFYATGTGLTPFLSMISYALETEGTKRDIFLKQGFRNEENVFAEKILSDLSARFPNFHYEICLSQPTDEWHGTKGRITTTIDAITDTDIDVYICGAKQMITDVETAFKEKGVPPQQIYYEQFY
ncbi:MAG: FAD-binding oxidoreductase [Candidatus Dojkabacteria bacterium]|nr:MAG: FAD-binding oxidoreductase [Candidatus Dojkabacteria bacterium]